MKLNTITNELVPAVVPGQNRKTRKAHKIKTFKGDIEENETRNRRTSECW